MKSVLLTAAVSLALLAVCSLAPIAYGANEFPKRTVATFISVANNYPADASEFESPTVLAVKGRFGTQNVKLAKLLDCTHFGVKNVVAILTKSSDPHDADVEIPRISTILYDSCSETVKTDDKGNIEIDGDASGVSIAFKIDRENKSAPVGKTHWKKDPSASVFVSAASSVPPTTFPTSTGPLPCGGTVSMPNSDTISFAMCSKGSKPVYYAYALHMDQIGIDGIGVDIGIDPLIINRP